MQKLEFTHELLGFGSFGTVEKAIFQERRFLLTTTRREVAVKKALKSSNEYIQPLVKELKIMMHL